jgi:hypothetical protein
MVDEQKLLEDIDAGARAEAARGSLEHAFAELRRQYLEAWRGSRLDDVAGRERLWQADQILGRVEAQLRQVANGGKIARRQLEEIERLRRAEGSEA